MLYLSYVFEGWSNFSIDLINSIANAVYKNIYNVQLCMWNAVNRSNEGGKIQSTAKIFDASRILPNIIYSRYCMLTIFIIWITTVLVKKWTFLCICCNNKHYYWARGIGLSAMIAEKYLCIDKQTHPYTILSWKIHAIKQCRNGEKKTDGISIKSTQQRLKIRSG